MTFFSVVQKMGTLLVRFLELVKNCTTGDPRIPCFHNLWSPLFRDSVSVLNFVNSSPLQLCRFNTTTWCQFIWWSWWRSEKNDGRAFIDGKRRHLQCGNFTRCNKSEPSRTFVKNRQLQICTQIYHQCFRVQSKFKGKD